MSALRKSTRDAATAHPTLLSAPLHRSALLTRLTRPDLDPAKRRIRGRLMMLSDEQLREGLGWSRADIDAFRSAGCPDEQAGAARTRQEVMSPSSPLPMAA